MDDVRACHDAFVFYAICCGVSCGTKILIIPVPQDINSLLRQKIMMSHNRNELNQRPKTSFLVLSKTNIGSKTFLCSSWKVLILCDFLNLGCLRTATISHRNVDFLI